MASSQLDQGTLCTLRITPAWKIHSTVRITPVWKRNEAVCGAAWVLLNPLTGIQTLLEPRQDLFS